MAYPALVGMAMPCYASATSHTHGKEILTHRDISDLVLTFLGQLPESMPVGLRKNHLLNRMALVYRWWHNALAPQTGVCMSALTRCITLCEADMETKAWFVCVKVSRGVTKCMIASLAAACPAITTLDLSGCCQLTDEELASLAAGCPAITTLDLSGCYQLTDVGLERLAAGCPAITTLCLSGCHQLTDAGLASLAAGCPAISTLGPRAYCIPSSRYQGQWGWRIQGQWACWRYCRRHHMPSTFRR